jgi:anti-sigma B factor antagonist
MEFGYTITDKGKYTLVSLKGNLIEKNQANELVDDINEISEKETSNFIISLEEFQYMNSTGLNVMLGILSKARKSGGEAVICNVPEKIKTLLVITKLINVFSVVENEAEAELTFLTSNSKTDI